MGTEGRSAIGRRAFLASVGSLAAAPLLGSTPVDVLAQEPTLRKQPSTHPLGRRRLGSLEVSSVGLGVQNMSRKYETTVPYRPEMIDIIRAAYDRGVTFFDTAEAYGPFECERILGESIAPFRDKVVITSKFGWNIDLETGERRAGLNSKPDHIKRAVEGSLKRLRTDRIDLLYQHRVDPAVPIEDVAGAVGELMKQGKVRHWGLSEMGLGGFVPWSPLGVQFLTGWIDANTRFAPGDIRGVESRFSPENLPHNLQLVALVKRWAERKQTTPAGIALAWLMAQKPWIVPIPGTTQMAHMLGNSAAAEIRFTSSEIAELNSAVRAIEVRGARLPDQVLVFSGVEAPPKK